MRRFARRFERPFARRFERPFARRFVIPVVSVGVLVVLLVSLAGCFGSGSGETQTYVDPTYGHSFAYPAGWELQEDGYTDVAAGEGSVASVGVYDPEGANAEGAYVDMAQVEVYQLHVEVGEETMAAIRADVESVLVDLEAQAGDLQVVEPLREIKVGKVEGYRITYSFAKNGMPVVSTLHFLFAGDLEYLLILQASTDTWDRNRQAFEALVKSFRPAPAQSSSR